MLLQHLLPVADSTAKHTSYDIAATIVARQTTIGDGERERADVISNNTIGHIDVVGILRSQQARVVTSASQLGGETVSTNYHGIKLSGPP